MFAKLFQLLNFVIEHKNIAHLHALVGNSLSKVVEECLYQIMRRIL